MREQGKIFAGFAVFVLGIAIWYGIWSGDPTGTTALFMAFALGAFIAFYLLFTAKRVDTGASDNPQAEVSDDAGVQGFFSPHSWMPLSLGIGGALMFSGVIFGWWLMAFSAPVLLFGIWGWVFEYYRGENRTQ